MSHRLPCEFIQDMLPLYIDGIAGRASDEAIREHIAGCSDCREMLEQMAKLPPKTQERIGYIIEGALVLAESRDEEPAEKPGPEKSA